MEQQLTMVIFQENLERIINRWLGTEAKTLVEVKRIEDCDKKEGQKALNTL